MKIILSLAACLLLNACGVWVPGEITWQTHPASDGSVLSPEDYPGITFSEEVNREEPAGAVEISGPNGTVPGEAHWREATLRYIPRRPLAPGIEWTLSLETILKGESGRTTPISLSRPFYSGLKKPPLEITSVTPAAGEAAGAETPITLTFSRPVSRESLRQAWSIQPAPDGGCRFLWDGGDRAVSILPHSRWTNQEIHRWEIAAGIDSGGLSDTDGCPLPRPEEGILAVQEDRERPRLLSWEAVSPDGTPQGEFTPESALELTFSQELDRESLSRGISWSPSGDTYWRFPGTGILRLCPQTPWPGDDSFELTLSTDLTNSAGTPFDPENGGADQRTIALDPSPPPLRIEEIRWTGSGPEAVFTPEDYNQIHTAPPLEPLPASGGIRLTLLFSQPAQPGYQETLPQAVSLNSWLPEDLPAPQIQFWGWTNPQTLFIHYTGLTSAEATLPHWYRLSVSRENAAYCPQGRLEEDLWLILQG